MAEAVFLFGNTHDVMAAEKMARASGFEVEVIPEPPGRLARCGVALRLPAHNAEEFYARLAAAGFNGVLIEYR